MTHPFFSADYTSARQRFCELTRTTRGRLEHIPIASIGPRGEALAIDIAWFGAEHPRQALIHVSGIHGVEGFAGSAIQLAAIQQPHRLPEDVALIFIHGFNPYGMAWLRRCNGSNVDLNRNFFFGDHNWQGESSGYSALDHFLNPQHPPGIDMFHLRLLMAQASLSAKAIRQAIASGQHVNPKGLFFSGNRLEEEPQRYLDWLQNKLRGVERLSVIDVHTGLGSFGQSSLFLRASSTVRGRLQATLDLPIATQEQETDVMGYEFDGGHCEVYRSALPDTEVDFITQEFGTWSGRRLLRALRAENQHHHYGAGTLTHWSKDKLREAFCPTSPAWREQVVSAGSQLLQRALALLPAR